MIYNLILLIDFSNFSPIGFSGLDLDNKILLTSSLILELFLRSNTKCQISLIIARGGKVEQVTHLSGNISHHNQGLRRMINFEKRNGIDLKASFLLMIRLLSTNTPVNCNKIIFLTKGFFENSYFHFICATLLKNHIVFSVFSFGTKIFILDLLTKITGGNYILLNNCTKSEIFSLIQPSLKKIPKNLIGDLIRFGATRLQFFSILYHSFMKGNFFLNKLKIFCPQCKSSLKNLRQIRCLICGIFLQNFYLPNLLPVFGLKFFERQKKITRYYSMFSSIFWEKNTPKIKSKQKIEKNCFAFFERKINSSNLFLVDPFFF
mmetsp:Transcript_9638/g.19306  ORF Transcript_9638/g.19306 Transcript_9638/m.19306 type:complete len:319 (+) Transcript_9638:1304-2260(+)